VEGGKEGRENGEGVPALRPLESLAREAVGMHQEGDTGRCIRVSKETETLGRIYGEREGEGGREEGRKRERERERERCN
jgi:hypothetical protein